MAHRPAPGAMGHAQVQTTTGQTGKGMGVAQNCKAARAQTLRPLAPAPHHLRPACGSRMTGDCHVRFYESRGVRFPRLLTRLFSHISMNWRGRPLTSHDVIVQTIAATTTRSGLKVHAELDTATY